MKRYDRLEDVYKEKFSDFSSPPPQAVWQQIEARLARRKRRRLVAWWFPLAALGLCVCFGLLRTAPDIKQTESVTKQNVTSQIQLYKENNIKNTNLLTQKISKNIILGDELNKLKPNNILQNNIFLNKKDIYSDAQNSVLFAEDEQEIYPKDFFEVNTTTARRVETTEDLEKIPAHFNSLPTLEYQPVHSSVETANNYTFPIADHSCYGFKGIKNTWDIFVEAFGGAEYSVQQWQSKSEAATKYINIRKNSETFVTGHTEGIRLGLVHSSGLALRIGASASHLLEKMKYVNESEERTTTAVNIIRDLNGNIIRMDTTTATITGRREKETYNRFTTFDLPLQFGFDVPLSSKRVWGLNAYGGVLVNLKFKKSGEILTPTGIPARFNDSFRVYSDRVGLGLTANLGASYRFADNWRVGVESGFLYPLQSLTLNDYPLQQRTVKVNLVVGLRYEF